MNAHFLGLLKLKAFTPDGMRSYVFPSEERIDAFLSNARGAVDFNKSEQFTYCFDLKKNHAFNKAAHYTFFYHFEHLQRNQHWLHEKIFDKCLITQEIVLEVLDTRLKTAYRVWAKRFNAKVSLSLREKHDKRANDHLNTICKCVSIFPSLTNWQSACFQIETRQRKACTRSDIRAHLPFISSAPKFVHSDDDSGNEGKSPEKFCKKSRDRI